MSTAPRNACGGTARRHRTLSVPCAPDALHARAPCIPRISSEDTGILSTVQVKWSEDLPSDESDCTARTGLMGDKSTAAVLPIW